jgi:predicted TIM-barrel fold metal-dependent hydrolase
MIAEVPFYGLRNYVHMLLSGVFERFPTMKFVITEAGSGQFESMNRQLDGIIMSMRHGSIGELKYAEGSGLPQLASDYFKQNVWLGASFPSKESVEKRHILAENRFMWGSDYPHDEGTGPFSREHLRQVMIDVSVDEKRRLLGLNAADLYDFDIEALAPLVAEHGPTVAELEQPLTELPEGANRALILNQA